VVCYNTCLYSSWNLLSWVYFFILQWCITQLHLSVFILIKLL
jgi:hypothetical protein